MARPTKAKVEASRGASRATETVRIDREIEARLRYVASRRTDGEGGPLDIADLVDPVIEPVVQERFEAAFDLYRDYIRAGQPSRPQVRRERGLTRPIRVRRWASHRLSIISAVERVSIGSILNPVLGDWSDEQFRLEAEKVVARAAPDVAAPDPHVRKKGRK